MVRGLRFKVCRGEPPFGVVAAWHGRWSASGAAGAVRTQFMGTSLIRNCPPPFLGPYSRAMPRALCESGPLRVVHLERHKLPGGLVN